MKPFKADRPNANRRVETGLHSDVTFHLTLGSTGGPRGLN